MLPGGEVGLAPAQQVDVRLLLSQDVAHGVLKDQKQVGHPHLLPLVGAGAGHLPLDAPDDGQVVLLHFVHVPGDRQGQLTHLLGAVQLPQPLVQPVGPGHDALDVLRVLFQEIELIFQVGGHQKQPLVPPLVLLRQQEAAVALHPPQHQGGQQGPGQSNHHQPDQDVDVGQPPVVQGEVHNVGHPVAQPEGPPKLRQGGLVPVPHQQAQQPIVAGVENCCRAVEQDGLGPNFAPSHNVYGGAHQQEARPGQDSGQGGAAVLKQGEQQHRKEHHRPGDAEIVVAQVEKNFAAEHRGHRRQQHPLPPGGTPGKPPLLPLHLPPPLCPWHIFSV